MKAETVERRHLEQRLERLATELATLRGGKQKDDQAAAPGPESAVAVAPPGASDPTDLSAAQDGVTPMERALIAAGIDATTATEMKRRRDELTLSEIYLRDLASREGWLDTPAFAKEMEEIQRQRSPIRDEIGDAAYDRYLAALEHPNRVAVNEVLLESPAAVAGIQAGDVVLRYGEARIFEPKELVTATRGGIAGEPVQVEIIRQGQRLQIEVPRGPLGVTIAASHGDPDEG
jgi:membrane-associated protease RseP (regulator of RpoE activity)